MADLSVIKEYLVRLGFDVKSNELAKFNDALRSATQQVERVTSGMTKAFVVAGGAVLTTLTAIATGTVGLMDHVAQSDLGFQVWARRMYLSTDAAKSLKIATDALGYSLEDIVWGPKELQERFGILQGDQARMMGGLGGDFETQMRRIRDIRFEFTRLGVELQYLAMQVVKSLSVRLFGNEGTLLERLKEFNDWFISRLPQLGDKVATYLVPVLKDVWHIFTDIFQIARMLLPTLDGMGHILDSVANATKTAVSGIKDLFEWIEAHPLIKNMIQGAAIGGAAGSVIPGIGTGVGAAMGAAGGAGAYFSNGTIDKNKIQDQIVAIAKSMGLDPAIALAIAQQESGFNPNAKSNKGALGLFQLMPGTASGLGVDPNDPQQNIRGGIGYLLQLFRKYKDWNKAFIAYNEGPGILDKGIIYPGAKSYAEDAMKNSARWRLGMENGAFGLDPTSYSGGGINVGGVTVHITEPHATPEQIHKAVVTAIDDKLGKQTQRNIAQLGGAFA